MSENQAGESGLRLLAFISSKNSLPQRGAFLCLTGMWFTQEYLDMFAQILQWNTPTLLNIEYTQQSVCKYAMQLLT